MENQVSTPTEVRREILGDLKRKGLRLDYVAKELGYCKQTVYNILCLSSHSYLTAKQATRFHEAFGYSIGFLVSGEGSLYTWGGARPGAGKPSLPDDKKRVNITIRVAPETAAFFSTLGERGVAVGRLLDDFVQVAEKHMSSADAT